CSQPLSTNQTPHPTTKTWGNNTPPTTHSGQGHTGLLSQSPTVCLVAGTPKTRGNQKILFVCAPELAPLRIRPVTGNESIQRIVQITELPHTWAGLNLVVLLRKEVIQPHLP